MLRTSAFKRPKHSDFYLPSRMAGKAVTQVSLGASDDLTRNFTPHAHLVDKQARTTSISCGNAALWT